jgi:hypothetical protein
MAIFMNQQNNRDNSKGLTATSEDILNGKTAEVNGEIITGNITNNGDVRTAIENGILKSGYTSGGTIENLNEENIKYGVTILGKTGTHNGLGERSFTLVSQGNVNISNDFQGKLNDSGSTQGGTVGEALGLVTIPSGIFKYSTTSATNYFGGYENGLLILKKVVFTSGTYYNKGTKITLTTENPIELNIEYNGKSAPSNDKSISVYNIIRTNNYDFICFKQPSNNYIQYNSKYATGYFVYEIYHVN